jgi:hypothetical protein
MGLSMLICTRGITSFMATPSVLLTLTSVRPLPRHYAACFNAFLALRILVIVAWILSWPQPSYKDWGPAYLQEAVVRLRHFLGDRLDLS